MVVYKLKKTMLIVVLRLFPKQVMGSKAIGKFFFVENKTQKMKRGSLSRREYESSSCKRKSTTFWCDHHSPNNRLLDVVATGVVSFSSAWINGGQYIHICPRKEVAMADDEHLFS